MITSSPLISIRYVYTSQWRRKGVLPTCLPGFMIKHNFEIIQVNFFKVKNQVPTRRCRFMLTYWLTVYGQSKTVAEKIKHYSVFLNCATAFRIWKDYTKINMGVTRDETFYDTSEICVEEITFVSFGRPSEKRSVVVFYMFMTPFLLSSYNFTFLSSIIILPILWTHIFMCCADT